MTFEYSRLADSQYISDSAAAIVTNAASTKTYIRTITLHNTHTSALEVTLYRVPDNAAAVGTAGVANQVWKDTIISEDTVLIELSSKPGWVLEDTNDTLQAVCGTASKVVITVDGGSE